MKKKKKERNYKNIKIYRCASFFDLLSLSLPSLFCCSRVDHRATHLWVVVSPFFERVPDVSMATPLLPSTAPSPTAAHLYLPNVLLVFQPIPHASPKVQLQREHTINLNRRQVDSQKQQQEPKKCIKK